MAYVVAATYTMKPRREKRVRGALETTAPLSRRAPRCRERRERALYHTL